MRFLLETAQAVRQVMPDSMPLFTRISATDWTEGGWDIDDSIELSQYLHACGVDLIDCSSGGNVIAKIPAGSGYQVGFAQRIREEAGVPTAAVGMITDPAQADTIIRTGQADMVLLAREMLRDAYWALHAARKLGASQAGPNQYLRAL
jgi:2,4-dienoyl-CoA reductase-like NADH-dependent reductase (Old Yellow Enzyme family)